MTTAAQYCRRAADTIAERDPIYGGPTEAGFRIALLWNALLELFPPPLDADDVMRMLLAMKIVRSGTENDRIDAIGYAACLAEAAGGLGDDEPPSKVQFTSPPKVECNQLSPCRYPQCIAEDICNEWCGDERSES